MLDNNTRDEQTNQSSVSLFYIRLHYVQSIFTDVLSLSMSIKPIPVVQVAEAAGKGALSVEIRAYAGARLEDVALAGCCPRVVVEFLAAAVASGGAIGAHHIYDANGRQWVSAFYKFCVLCVRCLMTLCVCTQIPKARLHVHSVRGAIR